MQTADSSEEVGRIEPRNGSINDKETVMQKVKLPGAVEAQFAKLFAANDRPKRDELRVWPDGMRTDDKVIRIGAGMPYMKSTPVRGDGSCA